MNTSRSIKTVLRLTIHNKKKTVTEIADEIGVSENSLYRYCIEGESGSEMPLSRLIPLMKTTNNYELLKHIAGVCDHVCIKIPKFSFDKKDDFELVNEYQNQTVETTNLLKQFNEKPNIETFEKLSRALLRTIELSMKNQKIAEKKISGQMELL